MGEVSIRRAVEADLQGVVLLLDEVDDLHSRALPWLFRQVDGANRTEALQADLSKSDHAMFVAHVDGSLSGAIYAYLRNPARAPIVRQTTVAELDWLVVKASLRRQNIGTHLVHAALHWAEASGATRTELGVYEFNDVARAFWAAVGFETLSRRLVRHSDPNT